MQKKRKKKKKKPNIINMLQLPFWLEMRMRTILNIMFSSNDVIDSCNVYDLNNFTYFCLQHVS